MFDVTLDIEGWFDDESSVQQWFDSDFPNTEAIPVVWRLGPGLAAASFWAIRP